MDTDKLPLLTQRGIPSAALATNSAMNQWIDRHFLAHLYAVNLPSYHLYPAAKLMPHDQRGNPQAVMAEIPFDF
jgi:hypothetical protein